MKLKVAIFTAVFFILTIANLGLAANCESEMQTYVVRGDLQSKEVGARLWDLQKLKTDSLETTANQCANELFEVAHKEMSDYWNSVAQKKNCLEVDSQIVVNETCTESIKTKITNNKAYLSLLKLETDLDNCVTCNGKTAVLSTAEAANAAAIAQVAKMAVNPSQQQCVSVPQKDRVDLNDSNLSAEAQFAEDVAKSLGSCLWGLVNGFFVDGIWNSVKTMWDQLSDPWGTLAALTDFATEFAVNPELVMKNLALNLAKPYIEKYALWDCFNAQKKSELLCSTMGESAGSILDAILGYGVVKKVVSATVRGTKKVVGAYVSAYDRYKNLFKKVSPLPHGVSMADAKRVSELKDKLKSGKLSKEKLQKSASATAKSADKLSERYKKMKPGPARDKVQIKIDRLTTELESIMQAVSELRNEGFFH